MLCKIKILFLRASYKYTFFDTNVFMIVLKLPVFDIVEVFIWILFSENRSSIQWSLVNAKIAPILTQLKLQEFRTDPSTSTFVPYK